MSRVTVNQLELRALSSPTLSESDAACASAAILKRPYPVNSRASFRVVQMHTQRQNFFLTNSRRLAAPLDMVIRLYVQAEATDSPSPPPPTPPINLQF